MKKLLPFILLLNTLFFNFIAAQPTQGLIGYWPFNGNANDYTGNGSNGVVYGATLTKDRFNFNDKAYHFNGINNYINFGDKTPPFKDQLSISVWIKTNSKSYATKYIIGKYGWSPVRGFHIIQHQLDLMLAWRDQSNIYTFIRSNVVINDDKWHHIFGKVSGNNWELWVDGNKVGEKVTSTPDVNLLTNYDLYVGGHFNNGIDEFMYFDGAIDDIRMYNRALTQLEIFELLNEGTPSYTLYTISTESSPTEGGATSGGGIYQSGTKAIVQAAANTGFKFLHWISNGKIVSTNPVYEITVEESATLTAVFTLNKSVTVTVMPGEGGTVTGAGDYNVNSTVKLTATPNTGYQFSNWSDGSKILSTNSEYTFIFTAPVNIIANFAYKEFTVATAALPGNAGTTFGSGKYLNGSIATVSCVPAPTYEFNHWTNKNGELLSIQNNYSFIVDEDKELLAFLSLQPILTSPPTAKPATSIEQNKFRANWNLLHGAKNYFIDVSIDKDFNNILSSYNNLSVGDTNTFMVSGLIPNAKYYYRIYAANGRSSSTYSNTIELTTLDFAPTISPAALEASSLTETSFRANWKKVEKAAGYYIDVALDDKFSNIISRYKNINVGDVDNFIVEGLTTNFNYYYRVRAYNSGGPGPYSVTISVAIKTDLVSEEILPANFALNQNFPNPFNPSTKISFSIPAEGFVKLAVYNLDGTEVEILVKDYLNAGTYEITFNSKNLPSGIYYYTLWNGANKVSKKMTLLK